MICHLFHSIAVIADLAKDKLSFLPKKDISRATRRATRALELFRTEEVRSTKSATLTCSLQQDDSTSLGDDYLRIVENASSDPS